MKIKTCIASFILLLLFSLNISTEKVGLEINNLFAQDTISTCDDTRCDYRNGKSYGCRLTRPDAKCKYTNNLCTGYETCDSDDDPGFEE